MDSSTLTMLIVLVVGVVGIVVFFVISNKNNKKKQNKQQEKNNNYVSVNKKKNTNSIKKKKQKVFSPQTNPQVMHLFFQDYDEKTAIFKISDNQYSACYEFSDVSFSKANTEQQYSIFVKYVDFLNSLNTDIHIQIIHCGIPIAKENFKKDFIYPLNNTLSENQKRLATEFNNAIELSMGSSDTTYCETRLLVITVTAETLTVANDLIYQYQVDFEEKFSLIGSYLKKWSLNDRFKFIYDCFNLTPFVIKYPDNPNILELVKQQNISIYDFLAPKEYIDCREKEYVVVGDEKKHKFIKVMYVRKFPTTITPSFYNSLTTKLEANIIVTENITSLNLGKTIKALDKKISGLSTERYEKIKRYAKEGVDYSYIKDEKIDDKIDNYQALRQALVGKKQKMFKKNILVCIIANDYNELDNTVKQVLSIANESVVEIATLNWQQLEGLQNVLPCGYNTLQFQRSLHSEACAESVPFNTKNIQQPNSLYYGLNLVSRTMLCCDRKKLMNGNGCVLATSGAGKSFFVKCNIEQITLRYPDDEIIILDPQGEYTPIINALNGQTIEISTTAKTYINPFDMELQYVDEDNDPVKTKIEYILAFTESIVGKLTGEQKSIIDRATKRIYQKYETQKTDQNKPSFPVFYRELQTYSEQEAKNLVLILERYVQGGMDIFSKDTNVNIRNKLVCFDLHNLTASMQTTGYLVVLEHIMNRSSHNKLEKKNSWLFIDEFHILLANQYSAEYIAKIFKIGRKLGVLPTIITQNIADVLNNEQGCKILSNSEFAAILKQKILDLQAIQQIYNISDEEAKYCSSSAPPGQGVIVYGETVLPFRNQFAKETYVYELNNTDGMQVVRG